MNPSDQPNQPPQPYQNQQPTANYAPAPPQPGFNQAPPAAAAPKSKKAASLMMTIPPSITVVLIILSLNTSGLSGGSGLNATPHPLHVIVNVMLLLSFIVGICVFIFGVVRLVKASS